MILFIVQVMCFFVVRAIFVCLLMVRFFVKLL